TAFSLTCATEPDSGMAMTRPLRMVQASATAAAEQLCAPAPHCQGARCRDRRAANTPSPPHRAARTTPTDRVRCRGRREQLVHCAAVALRDAEQFFYVADLEVGHAPSANLAGGAEVFKRSKSIRASADRSLPARRAHSQVT